MRALWLAVTVTTLAGGRAWAGGLGGFSADETTFLRGTQQICTPLPAASKRGGQVSCRTGTTAEIAGMGFRQGVRQSGAAATYRVDVVGGTGLRVIALESGRCRAAWTTVDPIARVVAVDLSPGGKLIAIEIETRVAGRVRSEVIAFALPAADRQRPDPGTPAPAADPVAPPPPTPPAGPPVDEKALSAALARGWADLAKRRWDRARAAFDAAAGIDPASPEAGYGRAVAAMGAGDRAAALARLAEIASGGHPEAIVWLIEAREEPLFRPLLADPGFRKTVGLDPQPGRALSAYERLVGLGGRWEQAAISCERPRINLDLVRRPRTFDLRLRSRCQGMDETTRLDGRWQAEGTSALFLRFPNPGGAEEELECQLETCRDGSGEDCLTCGTGTEMEMELRVVRR